MKEEKPDNQTTSYRVPIILAFIAVSFYITSIVMQYLNHGATN